MKEHGWSADATEVISTLSALTFMSIVSGRCPGYKRSVLFVFVSTFALEAF
jgi:hypothetical protein